jgi:precorrin-6y C5,15-methyltransferase (decarboxylating) CbiE subunit
MESNTAITIVGCGPGGADCLTQAAVQAVMESAVLVGSERLFALFPKYRGQGILIGAHVQEALDAISREFEMGPVTVLVSGDPGVCSLAKPIIARFGCARCRVIPGISSVQVAFARLGLDWLDAVFLTAHGRNLGVSPEECRRVGKIAILAGGAESWPQIAGFVKQLEALDGRRDVYVCENLTLPDERVRQVGVDEIASGNWASRSLVLLVRTDDSQPQCHDASNKEKNPI